MNVADEIKRIRSNQVKIEHDHLESNCKMRQLPRTERAPHHFFQENGEGIERHQAKINADQYKERE